MTDSQVIIDANKKDDKGEGQTNYNKTVTPQQYDPDYATAFRCLLSKPSADRPRCINQSFYFGGFRCCSSSEDVQCGVSLWFGVHVLVILLIGANIYYIIDGYSVISNEDDSKVKVLFGYSMMIFFGICIYSDIATIYGLYKCNTLIILLQTMLLFLMICVSVVWIILAKKYTHWALYILTIVYIFGLHTFYRLYKWGKYFQIGAYKDPDHPYPE